MINPFKRLKSTKAHARVTKSKGGNAANYNENYYAGGSLQSSIPDHVPLFLLVKYANRDMPLNLACRANTDLVCGAGFHLTGSNLEAQEGRDVLEIIEKFCEHNNFDKLLQRACYDMWVSGNTFLTWKEKDPHALRFIDQSNVVDIQTDMDGDPEYYYIFNRTDPQKAYSAGNVRAAKVHADQVIHWKFQAHESVFGTGLAQINVRRGMGYVGADGGTYYKKSAVEEREMQCDVLNNIMYTGVPRYVINVNGDEQVIADTHASMEKLKPTQAIVSGATDLKVETISNAPSNKFDSIIKSNDNTAIMGTMSPYMRIWSSNDSFSYASSKTAMASLFPLIDAMSRELKHHVELLFKMIIEKHLPNIDWNLNKCSIHFGSEKTLSIDLITQGMAVLEHPAFDGKWQPEDVLESLRDAGFPVKPINSSDKREIMREKRMHARVHTDDEPQAGAPASDLAVDNLVKHLNRKRNAAKKFVAEHGSKSTIQFGGGSGR